MEEIGDLNGESKTMTELEAELAEAYKIIAGKEAEIQRLLEKNAVLEKRHLQSEGDADDREPESSQILERKAEEIIPKECWRLVFQNLSPEDLLSCRQVCKTFNGLLDLGEFKGKWKFKLILPLLLPYLKTNDPVRDTWEHLFNPRLACRSWRHWIDEYVSEEHGTNSFPMPRTSDMPLLTSFRTAVDAGVFQQRFRQCKTNPFPSRSVYIGSSDIEPVGSEDLKRLQMAFIRKVGKLLKQFGTHIFRIRLFFDSEHVSCPDPLTLCKLIKGITTHLPNLSELVIHKDHEESEQDDEAEDKVATYIEENVLGVLPKLQALGLGGLDEEVENYLLDAYGPQLTVLETRFSPNSLSQFQMQQFKNVQKLWLALYGPADDALEPLRSLQSPLKLLKLSCIFWSDDETWNVDNALRNLKHLPIELLEIHLWLWERVHFIESGIDLEEYKNASIKTLIIHIEKSKFSDGNQISFNFLQALPKLENLVLKFSGEQIRTSHPAELPEVVKLNEYLFMEEGTDLPCHSNIWEKVPSLKTITLGIVQDEDENVFVKKSIFTRKKYDRIRMIAEGDGPERN